MHVKKLVDFNITCVILAIKGGVLKIPKHTAHRGCDGGFFFSFHLPLLFFSFPPWKLVGSHFQQELVRQFGADRLYPSTSFIVKHLEAFGCLGPPDSAETLVPACGEEASGYSLLVRLLIQPCVHHHQLEVQTSLKKEKKSPPVQTRLVVTHISPPWQCTQTLSSVVSR